MNRINYVIMFAAVAIMGYDAYEICKKCNASYYVRPKRDDGATRNSYHPRQSVPLLRDVSYLAEEDYDQVQEKRQTEQQPLDRDNRNLLSGYRNLCEIVTRKVQLEDTEYEYQPPHYYEVYCKNNSFHGNSQHATSSSKQKCVHPGFHCVQRGRPLYLVRRRWDSECWEPFVKEIASGCDCMWPEAVLGDITDHYSFPREWN